MHESLLFTLGGILILAVGAQWLAWRMRLPSILFLLLFGFLAGPITGILHPDEIFGEALFPLVSVAVGIILFEGGLSLHLSELPQIGSATGRLITIGAIITWALAAWGAFAILNLSLPLAVLLGAVLIVTGPTVVTPLLRQVRPKGRVGALLKWEGILIDPIGAVIAVLVFEAIISGSLTDINEAGTAIFLGVLRTILEGGGLGVIAAAFLVLVLRRYWLPDYLQNGVTLMLVVGVFALSNSLEPEAGLLATTVMGLVLANQRYVSINRIVEFTEDLQILLIGALFILLSARVPLDNLLAVVRWPGLLYLLFLIVAVRPITVILSTWFSDLTWRERLFTAWMAPRGIVAASIASIFAFELGRMGFAGADQLASITFMVIVGTVVFYGLTASIVARRLKLSEQNPQGVLIVGADRLARSIATAVQRQGFRALVVDTNPRLIRAARREGIETHYGNALSEKTSTDLDLSGLGRLLALTPNNEVNSLAALHYSDEFSRAEVFQLPMGKSGEISATSTNLHGRFLFDEKLVYPKLMALLDQGAIIKTFEIPEGFDYDIFRQDYEDLIFPLFLVTEQSQLEIKVADLPLVPRPHQTLICLVLPESEEVVSTAMDGELSDDMIEDEIAPDLQDPI